MRRAGIAAAAVLAACASTPAAAQTTAPATERNTGAPSDSFVQQAAVANQTDFQLGQLATIRGHSPQVRRFGQKMIDDHRSALDHYAEGGSVEFPLEIDAKHRQLEQELSTLSGREFDRRFIAAMVDDHQAMAAMLRDHLGDTGQSTAMARTTGDTDHTAATSGARGTSGTAGVTGATGTSGTSTRSTGERMGATASSGDAWMSRRLRTVQQHLAEAKRLQRSLGGSTE